MNIPPQAKKVFTGEIFNVYQWEQKLFDDSVETFEMIERNPCVNIIAVVGNKIILLIQEQPMRPLYPSLPAGKIDPGEKAIEAAKRELLEESGYAAEEMILLKEYFGASKIYFHEYLFLAKNCKKVAEQKLDSGEKIAVKLVEFDEFLQQCQQQNFAIPLGLKFEMYEARLNPAKKAELKNKIFG